MTKAMSGDEMRTPLNPSALPVKDAAKMLTKVGGQPIRVDMFEADVAAGAPTNADGTLNLVQYAAWLVKEMGRGN